MLFIVLFPFFGSIPEMKYSLLIIETEFILNELLEPQCCMAPHMVFFYYRPLQTFYSFLLL